MLYPNKHSFACHLIALACLMTMLLPARAQDAEGMEWLKKGNNAYEKGYFDVAAAYYLKAAQYKIVDAQLYLGYAFYAGEGMDKDYASAVMWYKRAVAQGSHKAEYNLAYCYMYGHGVPTSYEKAFDLLTASAKGGYKDAQRTLAECYQKGVLVGQDESKAKYWKELADGKDTDATMSGTPKNDDSKSQVPETGTAQHTPHESESTLEVQFADDIEIEFADGTKKEAVKPVTPEEEAKEAEVPVTPEVTKEPEDPIALKEETKEPTTEKDVETQQVQQKTASDNSMPKPRVIISPKMLELQKEQEGKAQLNKAPQDETLQNETKETETHHAITSAVPVVKILYPEDQSMFHTDRLPIMYQLIAGGLENETELTVLVDGEQQPTSRAVRKPNIIEVDLPNHDCTVMMYAQNKNGNSVPTTIRLIRENVVQQDLPRLYAVCIGVGTYDDPDMPNLKFTCKDATDFSEALMSKKGLPYADVQVKTLCDSEATRGDIFEALEWLRQESRPTDVCIFYYAGHGIRDEKDRFYFMPYGSSPKRLWDCFSADEFRKMAEDIDGKFIVFADACYSSALFEGGRSAALNHFIEQLRRTKNGMMFYASSASDTKSKEGPNWKNGAFTKALVEAFHGAARHAPTDEGLSTHDLESYVYSEVKKMTEGKQAPIFKNVGGLEHFTLFIYE